MRVDTDTLADILAAQNSRTQVRRLLQELLTRAERKTLGLRWKLLEMLHEGVPQREIAARLGVSLCKITRGSRILKARDSAVRQVLESSSDIH